MRICQVIALAIPLAGCAPAPDAPPPDPAPAEGVFGRAPPAAGGLPSVVMLLTADSLDGTGAAPRMDQLGLQFTPRLLIVRPGEPVLFTNSESIAHNIHLRSVSSGSTILNADTPSGESLSFRFDDVGGYDVLCDVHPGMTAFIYATDAAYAVFADRDGSFHVSGVSPGDYNVRVWSADADNPVDTPITVRDGEATEVTLTPLG